MHKKIFILLLAVLMMCMGTVAFAAEAEYTNDQNGCFAIVEDDADILDNENAVLDAMKYVTEYTNCVVYTTNVNPSSAARLAENLTVEYFKNTGSGVVFLIDMDNRMIYICAQNQAYMVITDNVADTITDNVYSYASKDKFDECAIAAMSQIYTKFSGKRIPEPMRYIGNAFLAVMLGIGITAVWACYSSRVQVVNNMHDDVRINIYDKNRVITDVRRVRRSSSSSSGGGGGGRSGGGGGSRGGGGHRF